MVRRALQHPFRSIGAMLTAVAVGLVFVVLILPALAAAGSPNGKNEVRRYLNQKLDSTQKVKVGKWFYIEGKNFGNNGYTKVTDVGCWENRALTNEGRAPHWTTVSNWSNVAGTSRLLTVDLNDDCAGVHGRVIAVQFYGEDNAPGDSAFGDDPGDPGDDVIIVGPPVAIAG